MLRETSLVLDELESAPSYQSSITITTKIDNTIYLEQGNYLYTYKQFVLKGFT